MHPNRAARLCTLLRRLKRKRAPPVGRRHLLLRPRIASAVGPVVLGDERGFVCLAAVSGVHKLGVIEHANAKAQPT